MSISSSGDAKSGGGETPPDCGPSKGAALIPVIISTSVLETNTGGGEKTIGFAIVFNTKMDRVRAESVANYRLLEPVNVGGTTRFLNVSLEAIYVPLANTVNLEWRGRPQFALGGLLTINGTLPLGLTSDAGYFLDGENNGQAGTNANGLVLPNATELLFP
jgi:hypothetical protein